jgi:SAM-dependent methyltransferase
MPTIDYLSNAYPTDYYSYTAQPSNRTKRPRYKKLKRLIRRLIGFTSGWTGDPYFRQPGRMLDIGCGTGTFLLQMRDKGWNVHGVELSLDAAERGRQQGLDIFGGTIEAAGYPDSTFDYVRSNHSFEHIHNPREVLREIRRIMKPKGLLFIGVPNVNGLMSRLYGTYWWYLGAPVHTFGYSPATLKELLVQEGFLVKKVNYNSTFGGVFGSLQIVLNRNNGKSSEEGWAYNNPAMRLLGHWIAKSIDFFRAGDCIEVIAEPMP